MKMETRGIVVVSAVTSDSYDVPVAAGTNKKLALSNFERWKEHEKNNPYWDHSLGPNISHIDLWVELTE